jgi:outer membrane lipase/esterase
MKQKQNSLSRKRWVMGAGGVAIGLLPMAFPHWVNVIAETYTDRLSGLSGNGGITGEAIMQTCVTGENQNNPAATAANKAFQADCNIIAGGLFGHDQAGAVNAMNQLAADQIAANNAAAGRQFQSNVSMLAGRLARIRLASGIPAYSENSGLAAYADQLKRDAGGGASSDGDFGRLGTFFNLKYRGGDEDSTRNQAGFDFKGWGVNAGADYRFNDNAVAGIALSYSDDDIDYDAGRGDMSSEMWGISAYGSYYMDSGLFLDGLIGYNGSDYKLNRRIVYSVNSNSANQTAKSSPEGDMLSFSIGGGYAMPFDAFTFTPLARIDYLRNEVDSFHETMSNTAAVGGSMSMAIDSATYKSFTSHVGAQISRAFSYSGGVILPQIRLDWIHEFENDQKQVGARFINDINNTPFFVLTNNPDRDYFDLGLSVSAQFAHGRSAFLEYDTLLGFENVNYHAVNAGVRLEF